MSNLKWILPSAFIWTIVSLGTGIYYSPFLFPTTIILFALLYFSFGKEIKILKEEKIDLKLCKKICDKNGYVIESGYGGFVIMESDNFSKNYFHIYNPSDTWSSKRLVAKYCVHKTLLDAQKWILKHKSLLDRSEIKPVFGAGIDLIKEQNEQHLELKELVSQMVDAHNREDFEKEDEIFDIIEKRKLV